MEIETFQEDFNTLLSIVRSHNITTNITSMNMTDLSLIVKIIGINQQKLRDVDEKQ